MYPERGFTLVELLTVMLAAIVLLGGFSAFYRSEQRAFKHHQVEIESSQDLRTALDQMSRELRLAGRDLTGVTPTPTPGPSLQHPNGVVGVQTVTVSGTTLGTGIGFRFDGNDNHDYADTTTYGESRKFCILGGQAYTCNDATISCSTTVPVGCTTLASNIDTTNATAANRSAFEFFDCNGNATTTPVNIARVGIRIHATRTTVGGLPVDRTEIESVRLRNKRCS